VYTPSVTFVTYRCDVTWNAIVVAKFNNTATRNGTLSRPVTKFLVDVLARP